MDLFMQYGMAAGIDAVEDSKLLESQIDYNRIGCIDRFWYRRSA
jgi:hypothetical protein